MTNHDLPNTEGTLQLVVAWNSGRTVTGRYVKTATQVELALRGHAENAVARMTTGAPYSPDTSLEDNSHLEASLDELFDTALLDELSRASSLPLATEDELRTKPLLCHAVVIGQGEKRAIFVKKRSPIQLAKKSMVAFLVNNNLDRVEAPIFAFDDKYDAIISPERVYVLNKDAFEGLFKESPAVLAKTEEWVKEVVESIPMTKGSVQALDGALKRNQFLRKKFLAIKNRPHILSMTPDALRVEIERHGYDSNELMDGNNLKVTEQNVKTVLQLLNEDLFSGGFSQERYAAGSKRTVP